MKLLSNATLATALWMVTFTIRDVLSFGVVRSPRHFSATPTALRMSNSHDKNVEHSTMDRREVITKSLGTGLATITTGLLSTAGKVNAAQEWLTEPTDEFKESERQRADFRRTQLEIKKKFGVVFDRLTSDSKTEDQLRTDLEELTDLVKRTGGLPLGIKRDDVVKIVRAKKAKGFWPTSVEIAYQDLINEIRFQQSPNKEKEENVL